MKRVILMSMCVGAVALSSACSRRDTSQEEPKNIVELATHPAPAGSITPVTVTGCLSASGNRFVLAQFDKEASKTVAYQLINADDQLRNLVGKEVRVSGEAQPTQVAETREVSPPTDVSGTSGKAEAPKGAEPTVTTVTDTKLDMQKMTVASVTATGDACEH